MGLRPSLRRGEEGKGVERGEVEKGEERGHKKRHGSGLFSPEPKELGLETEGSRPRDSPDSSVRLTSFTEDVGGECLPLISSVTYRFFHRHIYCIFKM